MVELLDFSALGRVPWLVQNPLEKELHINKKMKDKQVI